MKIKLLSRMASPEGNYAQGSFLDIAKNKAMELINGGYAQALEPIVEDIPIIAIDTDKKETKLNKRR